MRAGGSLLAAVAALLLLWQAAAKEPRPPPRMITLHEEARIFLFENLLTPEECDHIIALAEPRLQRSGVNDPKTGRIRYAGVRTSSGTFLRRAEDPIIADIEQRIARWTLLPVANGEGLQVLRYGPSQKYDAHYDTFVTKEKLRNGGNRYATVLMYLNDVEEGGETAFPNIPAPGGDNGPGFSECARYHLAAKPKKGSAVLFHSFKPSGEHEPRSLHTACPVIKGIKYSAPKWIHVGRVAGPGEHPVMVEMHPQPTGDPPGCKDTHPQCASWAASGECERNPSFMLSSCARSCQRCDLLAAGAPRLRRSSVGSQMR